MATRSVYKKKLQISGETERDRHITHLQSDFKNGIQKSPSYKQVIRNGVDNISLSITSTTQSNIKQFVSAIGNDIRVGDLFEYENSFWLITRVDADNEILQKGLIQQCNFKLRYQLGTSEILEQWCVITNTYTEVSKDNKVTSTPVGQTVLLIPYNENTSRLHIGKRIMTETTTDQNDKIIGITFKITSFDGKIFDYGDNGRLLRLGIESVAFSENDNISELVCDYISNTSPPPSPDVPSDLLKCEILGRDNIKIGGSTRTYSAKFYDVDGITEIDNITPIWSFICDSKYQKYIRFEQVGNLAKLTCLDAEDLIGENIALYVVDSTGLYQMAQINIICGVM